MLLKDYFLKNMVLPPLAGFFHYFTDYAFSNPFWGICDTRDRFLLFPGKNGRAKKIYQQACASTNHKPGILFYW
jgi:hypothetical protein